MSSPVSPRLPGPRCGRTREGGRAWARPTFFLARPRSHPALPPPHLFSRSPLPTRRPTLLTAAALAALATCTAWALARTGSAPVAAPPYPALLRMTPRRAVVVTTAAARLTLPTAAPPPPPPPPRPPRLPVVAICAIVKDQAADLPEWLALHAGVGVGHVFLYDHASAPRLDPATTPGLAPFVAGGFLTLVTAPADAGDAHPSGRAQLWAYDDCLDTFGRGQRPTSPPAGADAGAWAGVVGRLTTTAPPPPDAPRPDWLAFIDVDEFIMPTGADGAAANASTGAGAGADPPPDAVPAAVAAFAATHPDAGGWALNWVLFGSSGHATRPPAGVLASYTACLPATDPENTHVKTVARVGATLKVGPDPHHFLYRPGASAGALNGRGQVVPGGVARGLGPPAYAGLALHHYATKSRAEYGAKVARGSGMGNAKVWSWFDSVDARAVRVCAGGVGLGRAVLGRVGVGG